MEGRSLGRIPAQDRARRLEENHLAQANLHPGDKVCWTYEDGSAHHGIVQSLYGPDKVIVRSVPGPDKWHVRRQLQQLECAEVQVLPTN